LTGAGAVGENAGPMANYRIIDIQEAYRRKFDRQAKVPGLEMHAAGHCAHIGKISPGCYGCFSPVPAWGVRVGEDVGLPNVCNMNCAHCFREREVRPSYSVPADWQMTQEVKDSILEHFLPYNMLESVSAIYTFSGVSEPLFYLPVLEQYMHYFRNEIEKDILKAKGWAKVYTNGTLLDEDTVLRLRELGFDEVRVNPSASGFSAEVYRNIETAAEHLPVVTVEVPSWPPYRDGLLEMLPIIDSLGVRHLDVCQVEIMGKEAFDRIVGALPGAELYQGYWLMLDDGGLVEEIMCEVADKKYGYSVIDCNAFVKQVNTNGCMKRFLHDLCRTPEASGGQGVGCQVSAPEIRTKR